MNRGFTGRHMAAVMVGGFGVIVAVNLLMASLATSTFGGLVVENSYVASQNFNTWLDDAERAAALGWDVRAARLPSGQLGVTAGNVPAGATVSAVLRHPLGREPDSELAFRPDGAGAYASTAPMPAGRWIVRLEVSAGGEVWHGERNLQ